MPTGGVVLLCAFALAERRSPAPMLDLDLLRNRTFDGASLAVALGAGCGFTVFTYVALFLIVVQDRGPAGGRRAHPAAGRRG